jgi:hypothetical protein
MRTITDSEYHVGESFVVVGGRVSKVKVYEPSAETKMMDRSNCQGHVAPVIVQRVSVCEEKEGKKYYSTGILQNPCGRHPER